MADILQPVWKARPGKWDYGMAAHLMRRAGFGASEVEIEGLVAMGAEKAINWVIYYKNQRDELPEMVFGDLTGPQDAGMGAPGKGGVVRPRLGKLAGMEMTQEQRRAIVNLNQAAQRAKLEEMKLWWVDRMVRTKRPLEEKMTLFWHGLFVSSSVTVKNTYFLYNQNQLYRDYALGNYKSLALEVSKDPGMLLYLNNNENHKAHPNENYARELMELFTMGIGNYTENDIKESARAFTGWTFVPGSGEFVFARGQHDEGEKTFLGRKGNFTGEDIVDIIFEQPCVPKYIAKRLVKFFAVEDVPDNVVAQLAAVVKGSKFEMLPVMKTLLSSDWFFSDEVMYRQIKSPIELVVGTLKALGVGIRDARQMDSALKTMGQELFGAPTVKGWDGGRAWINTSTMFARCNLPAYLGTGRLPAVNKQPAGMTAVQRDQYADFETGWSPQVDLAQANVSTTDGVVDLYIRKLLAGYLTPEKRDDLLVYLNATGDTRSHVHDPISVDAERHVRGLVHLIMATMEYQLA